MWFTLDIILLLYCLLCFCKMVIWIITCMQCFHSMWVIIILFSSVNPSWNIVVLNIMSQCWHAFAISSAHNKSLYRRPRNVYLINIRIISFTFLRIMQTNSTHKAANTFTKQQGKLRQTCCTTSSACFSLKDNSDSFLFSCSHSASCKIQRGHYSNS